MIVTDFGDERVAQRLPIGGTVVAPPARSARRLSGEARRLDQRLEPRRQRVFLARRQGRSEADMVQPALVIVQAEQEGSDRAAGRGIAETADDAVGAAQP